MKIIKKFSMRHTVFEDLEPKEFTEEDPPEWLASSVFKWWWVDYVLKLEVGESIESDFQNIKRIE